MFGFSSSETKLEQSSQDTSANAGGDNSAVYSAPTVAQGKQTSASSASTTGSGISVNVANPFTVNKLRVETSLADRVRQMRDPSYVPPTAGGVNLIQGATNINVTGADPRTVQALADTLTQQGETLAGFGGALETQAAFFGEKINAQTKDITTTLRDTLSTIWDSPTLAGPAAESGGILGWVKRNKALAACLAVAGFFLFRALFKSRKTA